ncbi:MAG: DNA polymerase/3'-5' exonuclease PolX [Candidatus Rokuibacteriota bacterium]|nr:MAG: DNA polymerase/3'-5' exonuclease PolX [Candidatus Rokubacteria bacterium]
MVRNAELAALFEEMADHLELREESVFRIRAYRRAAQQLEGLAEDAVGVLETGGKIPGIGADLSKKIREYADAGAIAELEAMRQSLPAGVRQLMAVPGVGPRTAKLLYDRLGIDSVEALEAACRSGRVLEVPGVREKTRDNMLRGVQTWKAGQARMPLGRALSLGEGIMASLREVPGVRAVEAAGSLRRRVETVGDLDVLVTAERPAAVLERFSSLPEVDAVLLRGDTKCSIRHREGIQVDLRVVDPEAFGAALQYFTGSKAHNVRVREMAVRKKLKVNEYGVFDAGGRRVSGVTEEEVYGAVGLPWIPPELREDAGEIEAALGGGLPPLVEVGDLRGDLHAHTEWSDGHHPIEALVAAAEARGYEYIIISDHSRSSTVARGLTPERLREQIREVRALRRRHRIHILTGAECDVLADGRMDFPDDLLAELDVVLAAVHSRFKQPAPEMTARICRALENPHVKILVHPTGRLLGEREPYDVDLDRVFAVARAHGKAVEVSASPSRLDLRDVHARRARELGVLVAIDTDTHYLADLDHVGLGVATARRAWIGPGAVVNTWPWTRFSEWARAGRG